MSNNTLQVIKSAKFNGVKFDCYAQEGETNDFWATREQIGQLLDYDNPNRALSDIHSRHADRLNKFSAIRKMRTIEGSREITRNFIMYNFKGLLEICRYSNRPQADAVMDFLWDIADEIRRHGLYATPATMEKLIDDPDFIIRLVEEIKNERSKTTKLRRENIALETQRERDRPKVIFSEAVSASNDSILIGNLAKILRQNGIDIGQNRLFEWLRENGYLIKRKGETWNMPTQKSLDAGLFIVKKSLTYDRDGKPRVNHTVKVTGKGQIFFVNYFLGNKSKQLELTQESRQSKCMI